MPQVLSMTQKPDESTEQFAERIAGQVQEFFAQPNSDGTAAEQPDTASEPVSSSGPTDESAGPEKPEEEPAPSS